MGALSEYARNFIGGFSTNRRLSMAVGSFGFWLFRARLSHRQVKLHMLETVPVMNWKKDLFIFDNLRKR
jgi:hypothetical protein